MATTRSLLSASFAASLLATAAFPTLPHATDDAVTGPPREAARARAGDLTSRYQDDVVAMESVRPGYRFWQHIFTIPDGHIAFGSALDGRLLAVFPVTGDWTRNVVWHEPALVDALEGHQVPRRLDDRRDYVVSVLEALVGPVVHNPTRGRFLRPNAARYGTFLREWSAIYERFGVPADVGLAQALVESGLNGTRRSEASATGFCQWLTRNWRYLDRLAPAVIEAGNQTTQAAYCAAYLAVLGTKYGSLIPALSEHHAGGTNVGRVLVNGERLGGADTREQYFLGASLARDLRLLAPKAYSDLYRTYGPRSYFYAEMVFGNTYNVASLLASTSQTSVYGMRTRRAIPLTEVTKRMGMSTDQVRRFNPALTRRVPAGATLYLPRYVEAFGRDVSFWHRPASVAFTGTLADFMALDAPPEEWDEPSFAPVLKGFERRFAASQSEEGTVMATMLAYVTSEAATSGRREILAEFRTSVAIRGEFERAVRHRDAALAAQQ
ncbi:MAG TPA: hypothetical protein VMO26_27610 [Vicinamibacterales bacterium]|nr:hypothetical protein [Vicinamibacterales bacterium]